MILEAAKAAFAEQGTSATFVGIAARAGVHHSLLFYYFKSRENLLAECGYTEKRCESCGAPKIEPSSS